VSRAASAVPTGIGVAEFKARRQRLREHLGAEGWTGVVLFDPTYILYFTGFAFIPTERPIAFLMNARGEESMFVPRLEVEHARSKTGIARVEHYVEYPDDPHPMKVLARSLGDLGITSRIGADADGYPWVFGYRGPSLSELTGAHVGKIAARIEDWMMVKSEAELGLIRESVRWGDRAHRLLQEFTRVGVTETEVSSRASQQATLEMIDSLGPGYRSHSLLGDGASAGFRGQIGRNSAIPHALSGNITFRPGDVLVTGAGAPMWGYHSELERTMVIGAANDAQKRLFDAMTAAQDLAFGKIRPGTACAEVDRAVRGYFETHGLSAHWKHHTGHAIGLRYHEGPFLDVGDSTVIQPGMVFTVEPGIYDAAVGGFRHSDTLVVTEDGVDILTIGYPRDLEHLTIPEG